MKGILTILTLYNIFDRIFHTLQVDVPTAIGVGPVGEIAMETDGGPAPQLEKKCYIDSTYITVPRENMEINTPLRDGLGQWPLLRCSVSTTGCVL